MKKMISIFAALAAFAAFGVTQNTEWQDVPGTDKVGEVLSAGGAVTTEADPVWNAQKSGYQPKLVSGTNIKTVNGNSLLGSGNVEVKSWDGLTTNAVRDIVREQLATNGIRSVDGAARPLPKYLHVYEANDNYPDAAAEYYRSRGNGKVDGGCSSARDGGFLYRNFDYPFDDRAEFVVKMSAGPNRFASVGVAQVGTNLTEQIVTSGKPEYSHLYKWLPGATVDGINENGVVCEVNVVGGEPSAWPTNGTINCLGAVRWVLDNATNAASAALVLAAEVYFPSGWTQNFHWMIADERETWIVENGTASNVTEVAAKRVMTNFAILPDTYTGMGAERYALLRGGANITNAWYTNAYSPTANWASEFKDVAEQNAATNGWANLKTMEARRATGLFWQSVHTSIYDVTNRTLRVSVQEQDDWYTFAVPSAGGVKPEAVREIVDPMIGAATNGLRRVEDMAVYDVVRTENTDWTWTSENKELENLLNEDGVKPIRNEGYWFARDVGLYHTSMPVESPDDSLELLFEYVKISDVIYATASRPRYMDAVVTTNVVDRLATTNGVAKAIEAHHDGTKQNVTISTGGFYNFTVENALEDLRGQMYEPFGVVASKADRATTLSGYGITDGATKTELAGKRDHGDFDVTNGEKSAFGPWRLVPDTDGFAKLSVLYDSDFKEYQLKAGSFAIDFVHSDTDDKSELHFTSEIDCVATRSRYVDGPDTLVGAKYVDRKIASVSPANYSAVSNAAMNAIQAVTNADANLVYTITSDGAEPRFYFTPVGAIDPED